MLMSDMLAIDSEMKCSLDVSGGLVAPTVGDRRGLVSLSGFVVRWNLE